MYRRVRMTVREAISELRAENPSISEALALTCLKKVHRELYETYILKTETFDFSALTLAQTQITLDDRVKRVRTVDYLTASTDTHGALKPAATTDWDMEYPGWRQMVPSLPREFSVEEGKVTIYPPIPQASAGSPAYPRLRVTAAVADELTLDTVLPRDISPDVYIEGAKLYWCRKHCKEDLQIQTAVFQGLLMKLNTVLTKLSHHYRPQLTPDYDYQLPV